MSKRIEQLQSVLESRKEDPFVWYALAIEHRNEGNGVEALRYFKEVHTQFPAYVPNYLHYGLMLDQMGDANAAKEILSEGILKAKLAGDSHAHAELVAAREGIF